VAVLPYTIIYGGVACGLERIRRTGAGVYEQAQGEGSSRREEDAVMKILIVGLNFWPELVGVGKYSGEMAASLAAAGHDVRVVAGPPYYPAWRRGKEWPRLGYRRERIALSGTGGRPPASASGAVEIFRCPIYVPQQPTGFRRLLHLVSFAASSLPVLLPQLWWRPRVVMVIAPTLASAPGALMAARSTGALAWLHMQDFEVDAAYELGLLKPAVLKRIAIRCERWLLRRFDRISTISQAMAERLVQKGVMPQQVEVLPNWVDTAIIRPMDEPSVFRARLGIKDGRLVALYSGVIGTKQGLERVVDAARFLESLPLDFVICGEGPAKVQLEEQALGLDNVRFIALQPVALLNELLNLADIHLLPQRPDVADLVMPSKLAGMFASGRPVVAIANSGTQIAKMVEGCGRVVRPDSPEAFARAIADLAGDPGLRACLGAAGRARAKSDLSRDRILAEFERRLRAVAGS